MTYSGQPELQFQKPYVKLRLSNAPQPPKGTPRSVSRVYIFSLSALLVPHSFHLRSQKQRFGARSQRRHNRQPDACAVGPGLKPRLWRQRQRPAPSALATVLTGTRSGYFFRIFSPSERRFSNGCSSLYTNFILPGTGLDRAGLREPGGGPGRGAAATAATRGWIQRSDPRTCATSLFTNPAPGQQGPPRLLCYATDVTALTPVA